MDISKLLAQRAGRVEFSGIRKFFDLAARMANPCDLSIGQPDYDVPTQLADAAIEAIRSGKNRYTPSAGLPGLRQKISVELAAAYDCQPEVIITSGVSGGLTLALLAIVDPGDEIIFNDPYFVSYLQLVNLAGGKPVTVPSYPDFKFNAAAVEAAITSRTKAIILNSPGNPTGRTLTSAEVEAAARIAKKHDVLLISDEIYDRLCYDGVNPCPLPFAPDHTLLLRGFGKTYGITGWRMGYAAGPAPLMAELTKLSQYTFVCAPSMAQAAVLAAYDVDVSGFRRDYARKRDLVCSLLEKSFEFVRPSGGFYVFPKAPAHFDTATQFVDEAARNEVLVIPGNVFSSQDTHFRISYATSEAMIRRGCEILCRIAAR